MAFDYKEFLKTVPNRPGSYRMYGDENTVIYVGKAKDLKKRLSQYFLREVNLKTRALVEHIHHIEFTVTFSETEALILENNLIKQYQPHYNILLRDDKSYPYILLSRHRHPGLYYHRGAKKAGGEYFGPLPDASAVKESLKLLQKLFPIRQCSDTVYAHRSRPCLMAQIGKCLAPCVPMSEEAERYYQEQVELVRLFLKGQNQTLLNNLSERMESLSSQLKFEEAAKVRDQLLALRHVQEAQAVDAEVDSDLDVIASHTEQGVACVHVLFIRKGRILGTRSYFPKLSGLDFEQELLETFLEQFYLSEQRSDFLPREILLEHELPTQALSEAIFRQFGQKIRFASDLRGHRARFMRLAAANAEASLKSRLIAEQHARVRIEALEQLLKREGIEHLECFDISHTQGELTVASCVSFNREGPDSSRYRRFNIEGITPGDDFAAMHQVLTRRYRDPDSAELPEVIFIDGGKGQLKQAEEVLGALFAEHPDREPLLVGVAKGEGRKEGLETLIIGYTHEELHLDLSSPALQLVLHIRDEAHRFAITGHRQRRQKARVTSTLEGLPGVGPKRRQALLKHLGGMQEVKRAGLDDLKKVPGISAELAERIYDALHDL
ncbi:MAG: excinuclease ABC subunit UvrC [Succinivibrio sp.]|nr:excinuclease ABC subunit UvrC [Succinivibrio sp.]